MTARKHTIRLRAYTTKQGYQQLDRVLEKCRCVYNLALTGRRAAYKAGQVEWIGDDGKRQRQFDKKRFPHQPNAGIQKKGITRLRAADPELNAIARRIVDCSIIERLEKAYKAIHERMKRGEKPGPPRYKGRGQYQTLETRYLNPGWLKVIDDKRAILEIPGLPVLHLRHEGKGRRKGKGLLPKPEYQKRQAKSKEVDEEIIEGGWRKDNVPGTYPCSARITRKGRRVFVSLTYDVDKVELPETGADVGIDVGINRRVALSDEYAGPDTPKTLARAKRRKDANQRHIKALKRRQAKMRQRAREEGRARWEHRGHKNRHIWGGGKPPAAYRNAGAIRQNLEYRQHISDVQATHRLTTDIVRRYETIAMEKLDIIRMSKSAAGTQESPGRNVAQKRGLNREILAQQWGELKRQMAYKAEWAGRHFELVKYQYTSQDCHKCGWRDKRNRKGRNFRCLNPECGWSGDADTNAAINILARLRVNPAGDTELPHRGSGIALGTCNPASRGDSPPLEIRTAVGALLQPTQLPLPL